MRASALFLTLVATATLAAAEPPSMDTLRAKLEAAMQDAHAVQRAEPAPAKPRRAAPAKPQPAPNKPAAAHDAPHWSYQGEGAPEHWAELSPEFALCATGQRQSPIDIRGGVTVDLEPIAFDYRPTGFSVLDNGHTVQVNVGSGNRLTISGKRYELLQFHFHRPSEERIDGRQFEMVAHLVHKSDEGRLAVVAVLLQEGSVQPLIQQVWNALPLETGMAQPAPGSINLTHLLPEDRRYYTYMGSLTTPPCSEGVLWMVLKQPVTLTAAQIAVFSHLYPMNARPVQPQSGRLIKGNAE
ncbi:MAG: carbonic anhydrase family protein [Proteobacteria bacterium]|nr:carbonic anhydrase family protein [Pseudomonadota bacterium]